MKNLIRYTFAALLAAGTMAAHGQIWTLHGASLSAGGTGQFNTILESSPNSVAYQYGNVSTQAQNQQQFTTWSAGFLTSLQLHPVPWAGLELNYGYTHYSERFAYNYANAPSVEEHVSLPTDQHEYTAAYLVHPKHIPFQPFMGIGGGYIDFIPHPEAAPSQFRGAALLEMGVDLPTSSKHIAFRLEGRGLAYRAPNFSQPVLSTRAWRVQSEPVISAVYRF